MPAKEGCTSFAYLAVNPGTKCQVVLKKNFLKTNKEDLPMTEVKEDVLVTNLTGEDIHIFKDGKDLSDYQNNNESIHMTDKEADMLLGYMEGHGYHLGIKEGQLYRGNYVESDNEVLWEMFSMDDAIDLVCEWNYELILDNEYYFKQSGFEHRNEEAQKKYEKLKEDEKILDVLFDKTKYGEQVEKLAQEIAGEIIAAVGDPVKTDKIIQSLNTNVADVVGSYNRTSSKSR